MCNKSGSILILLCGTKHSQVKVDPLHFVVSVSMHHTQWPLALYMLLGQAKSVAPPCLVHQASGANRSVSILTEGHVNATHVPGGTSVSQSVAKGTTPTRVCSSPRKKTIKHSAPLQAHYTWTQLKKTTALSKQSARTIYYQGIY